MYNIKDVIEKMKHIATLNSNVDLSNNLNISYNTLNTWIKRGKLPQEVIFDFCGRYNCSLDYLLLNKEETLFNQNSSLVEDEPTDNMESFKYLATYEELNITFGDIIKLSPTLYISNGYYLIKKDEIYTIAKCKFDFFTKNTTLLIEKQQYNLSFNEFKQYNMGLIEKISK